MVEDVHISGYIFLASLAALSSWVVYSFFKPRRVFLLAALLSLWISWAYYAYCFIAPDFSLAEVAKNVNLGMPLWLRLAASWSGAGSSMLLLALFLSIAVYFAPLNKARALALLVVLSGAVGAAYGAFDTWPSETIGGGINPLLRSFWTLVHPPLVFAGYALVLAAALTEHRRMAYVGVATLFTGLVLGGYWSYVTFGWGGYWAWDPVETAQLMVFVAAVAYIHTPKFLKDFEKALSALVASAVFLALFVTRTGMSPLHGFASPGAAGYVLIAAALFYFFLFLRRVLTIAFPKLTPEPGVWSQLLAFFPLFAAAVFLYGALFLPSLGVALGVQASPPQMDQGMWFYNPALFFLVWITLAFAPLIYLGRGGRLLKLYLAAGSAATAVAAALVLTDVFLPSPKSHVLTNVAIGAALAWGAPAALVIAYRAVGKREVLGFLHLALLLFFIAAVVSLPYAYNKSYFVDVDIEPGASARVAGVEIKLVGYNMSMLGERFDARVYPVPNLAASGLLYSSSLLAQVKPMVEEAARRIEKSPALSLLFSAVNKPIPLGDVEFKTPEGFLVVKNASLFTYVGHGPNALYLYPAFMGVAEVNSTIKAALVDVRGVLINVTDLSIERRGDYLVFKPARGEAGGYQLPLQLDMNLTLYYMASAPGTPIYGLFKSPIYLTLANFSYVHKIVREGPPPSLPLGVATEVKLAIDGAPAEGYIYYYLNGEASGARGLVPAVLHIPRDLGDVYIAVFPPYAQGQLALWPAPALYYWRHTSSRDSLWTAAIITAANLQNALTDQNFAVTFLNGLIDFTTAEAGDQLSISVKEIPAVNLLWVSAGAAVALLLAYAARRR